MSDHPEYLALLAAVLASPRDDLPRLVLADWLEERGQTDRAVYIRCECEFPVDRPRVCERTGHPLASRGVVAPLSRTRCRCRVCSVVRRSHLASRSHICVEWEGDLRRATTGPWMERNGGNFNLIPWVDFRWCRGFPDEVRGSPFDLLHHLPHVLATCPIRVVRRVVGGRSLDRWEIDPPDQGSGWQVYVYDVDAPAGEWLYFTSFETREEAVSAIIDNVQTGGTL